MKSLKRFRRAVSFSLLLLTSCGYQWMETPESRTITIPYIEGDEDGTLTSELIATFTNSLAYVVRDEGRYRLDVKILSQQNDTIGYRLDPQLIKGKSKKNLVADEGRKGLALEVALYERDKEEPLFGPEKFTAAVDYDYVDGDSYQDLTFVDSFGVKQTVLAFSLGQLESTESALEAASRPLYQKISKAIVDSISARW